VSAPFQGRPGAQSSYAALRAGRPGAGEVIDPAAHDRLDALEGRVSRLEDAAPGDGDAGEDEAQDGE
jgi:hypothetical protein